MQKISIAYINIFRKLGARSKISYLILLFFQLVSLRFTHLFSSLKTRITDRIQLHVLNQILNQILQIHKQAIQLIPTQTTNKRTVLNTLQSIILQRLSDQSPQVVVSNIVNHNIPHKHSPSQTKRHIFSFLQKKANDTSWL